MSQPHLPVTEMGNKYFSFKGFYVFSIFAQNLLHIYSHIKFK